MIAAEAEGQAWSTAAACDETRWGHLPTRQRKEPSARRHGRALLITSISRSSSHSQRSPSTSDNDRAIARKVMTRHSCRMGAPAPMAAEETQTNISRHVRGRGGGATTCSDPCTGSWGNLAPRHSLSRAGNSQDVSHDACHTSNNPTAPASRDSSGRPFGLTARACMDGAITSNSSGRPRSIAGVPQPTWP